MERSSRALVANVGRAATAAVAAIVGVSCAALVDESSRPCPCLDGYVCCAGVCQAQGSECADAASPVGPDASTPTPEAEAASDAPGGEAAPDAPTGDAPAPDAPTADAPTGDAPTADASAPALDASSPETGPSCASLPGPRVHFSFSDCADGQPVRDTAGGATGTLEGSGVHCDRSPVGGALRFDGADDAGAGSYVRVADGVDAGAPACGEAGSCPPDWPFGSAITISALIDVANTGSYENILGQWYYGDSFLFNTFYDSALTQQIFRFSVQPAGAAQPANLNAPLQAAHRPASGSTWSHWVGVYDGASMSLYQDGVLVAAQTLDAGTGLKCTSVPLELGAVGRQGPCADLNDSYFTGAVGDVQIFDVALSASEVQALECSLRWPPSAEVDAGP